MDEQRANELKANVRDFYARFADSTWHSFMDSALETEADVDQIAVIREQHNKLFDLIWLKLDSEIIPEIMAAAGDDQSIVYDTRFVLKRAVDSVGIDVECEIFSQELDEELS